MGLCKNFPGGICAEAHAQSVFPTSSLGSVIQKYSPHLKSKTRSFVGNDPSSKTPKRFPKPLKDPQTTKCCPIFLLLNIGA